MGLIGSLGQLAYDIIANDKTGDSTKSAQKNLMTTGVAMTGVGVASKVMVDDVNNSFLEFDKSTTAVKALGSLSDEEFNKAKKAAIDLSTQVPISATDVSDSMYKMVSVGYDFDTMMKTIPEATKLAVGGNISLSDSVDGVINDFGAYGTTTYYS
ncbi:MAG: phage tail tape measure protein, partial [Methanospirillum sp.]|uniref:phage tail tape measure protein n=1 Tax=Methanospirillum sp. TaxID=45200 RepID=UPI00236E3413